MRFLLIVFHFIWSSASYAQCGTVVSVHDGDTFTLLLANNRKLKVRLAFVDAPEQGQEYGDKSKAFAKSLLQDKRVCLQVQYKDPYGRSIAIVTLADGKSLNEMMLKKGFVWHYTRYSNDKHLKALETTAKNAHVGIWSTQSPIPPWQWRKEHHIGRPKAR